MLLYLPVLLTLVVYGLAGLRAGPGPAASTWSTAGPIAAPSPRAGHWVWLRLPPGGRLHAAGSSPWPARRSSGPGESGGSTARSPRLLAPLRSRPGPRPAASRSPPHQVLIEPEDDGEARPDAGPAGPGRPGPDHRPGLGPVLSRLGSPAALSRRTPARCRPDSATDARPVVASPRGRTLRAVGGRAPATTASADSSQGWHCESTASATMSRSVASDGLRPIGMLGRSAAVANDRSTRTGRARAAISAGRGIVLSRIWAPWRAQYIHEARRLAGARRRLLPLPRAGRATTTATTSWSLRGPHSVVVLNRYPYNNGHCWSPRASIAGRSASSRARPDRADRDDAADDRDPRPDAPPAGLQIGLNQGKAAGAGLPGHLHWHIVPRWDGDTNFMPDPGADQGDRRKPVRILRPASWRSWHASPVTGRLIVDASIADRLHRVSIPAPASLVRARAVQSERSPCHAADHDPGRVRAGRRRPRRPDRAGSSARTSSPIPTSSSSASCSPPSSSSSSTC